ncbi:hypothetical protein HDV00_001345 [Rhizophlyctis rosea]|nr:hypothetical protein HDV00_001345 [Rhizophlyctis rosea]
MRSLVDEISYNQCFISAWWAGQGLETPEGDLIPAQFSPVELAYIISQPTYELFRDGLETHPHNMVHAAVGGDGGDMSDVMLSSNDPVFWLHHCNIDRWYHRWQDDHPDLADTYGGPRSANLPNINDATLDDSMSFYGLYRNVTVREAIRSDGGAGGLQCYTYSNSIASPRITDPDLLQIVPDPTLMGGDWNFPPGGNSGGPASSDQQGFDFPPISGDTSNAASGPWQPQQQSFSSARNVRIGARQAFQGHPFNPVTPAAYDRNDLFNIRTHHPIPESFLRKMGYTDEKIADVRLEEGRINQFIGYVNSVPGFTSRCALIHASDEPVPFTDDLRKRRVNIDKMLIAGAKLQVGSPLVNHTRAGKNALGAVAV